MTSDPHSASTGNLAAWLAGGCAALLAGCTPGQQLTVDQLPFGALIVAAGQAETESELNFGDDLGVWTGDGECDDPRFQGSGAAETLVLEDLGHDATDCAAAYRAGSIELNPIFVTLAGNINFGNDNSEYARDGECDDARFVGDGVAGILLLADIGTDASDCRELFQAGRIALDNTLISGPFTRFGSDAAAGTVAMMQLVSFGDDSGPWAQDGECDDWRFVRSDGSSALLVEDMGTDQTDCMLAWSNDDVMLHPVIADLTGPVRFGDNNSEWAHDGECDDPRFVGAGVAAVLSVESLGHDAADCFTLAEQGSIHLHPLLGGPQSGA